MREQGSIMLDNVYFANGIPEFLKKRASLAEEIVKFAYEKGKGMNIGEVKMALKAAEDHFLDMAKITDGMFSKEEG